MRWMKPSIAILLAVTLAGCAGMRHDRYCKWALPAWGVAAGGVAAGLGVSQSDSDPSSGQIAGAAAGGAMAGGILGAIIGHYVCEEPVAEAPPPPAAPPPAPPTARKIETILGPQFAFDKSNLTADGKQHVQHAVQVLKGMPNAHVLVEGHTDSIGTDAYNQRLSERRAKTVRDYMVQLGVEPSRVTARGYGKTRPVASNDTAEGRAQNRRVEILAE